MTGLSDLLKIQFLKSDILGHSRTYSDKMLKCGIMNHLTI